MNIAAPRHQPHQEEPGPAPLAGELDADLEEVGRVTSVSPSLVARAASVCDRSPCCAGLRSTRGRTASSEWPTLPRDGRYSWANGARLLRYRQIRGDPASPSPEYAQKVEWRPRDYDSHDGEGLGWFSTMVRFEKRSLSEADTCMRFITPALESAGWDVHTQIRRELSYTKGRIVVRGRVAARGEGKRADYILFHKPNIPLLVLEAKDNTHPVGGGMQQALEYAADLDLPFAVSSNGDGFVFHDRTGTADEPEKTLALHEFPSPADIWGRYARWRGIEPHQSAIVEQDYFDDGSGREPRYYQRTAINRTIEAISKGQDRVLLVMATGTGKTYAAFQIIWRLWKSGAKKRILYLADRNILIDQTRVNDFRPFGGAMTKVTHRQVDKSYEVYLALY